MNRTRGTFRSALHVKIALQRLTNATPILSSSFGKYSTVKIKNYDDYLPILELHLKIPTKVCNCLVHRIELEKRQRLGHSDQRIQVRNR